MRRTRCVVLIDDEDLVRWSMERDLPEKGYLIRTCATGTEGLAAVRRHDPALVLLDLGLPDLPGIQVLERIMEEAPATIVLIITAHSEVELAVEAMRKGARDFITKPYVLEDVVLRMERALERAAIDDEVRHLRLEHQRSEALHDFVARDPNTLALLETVRKIAASEAPSVLLLGESGTGKGVLAAMLHQASDRSDGPFVGVNCSTIPEHLLQSEVFGHERGAFTSATSRKRGLFETADGGTLFLDEVGDLPASMQTKLLSFLETRRFRRIGGLSEIEVDVRIVAATNRDLQMAIRDGSFRQDLYYRLNELPVEIPPLRQRVQDIPEMAVHFLEQACKQYGKPPTTIQPAAMLALERYPWPGNVRELKSVIARSVLLAAGQTLGPEDLPVQVTRPEPQALPQGLLAGGLPPDGIPLAEAERVLIEMALTQSGGNQSRAARLLRISRNTLRYRMGKYGLLP